MELNIDIKNWPLDLFVDYVLKIYHRNALEMMPVISELFDSDYYTLLMNKLQLFHKALLEYIYLENEIIFPKAIEFESKYAG
jgi:hypothetical protein